MDIFKQIERTKHEFYRQTGIVPSELYIGRMEVSSLTNSVFYAQRVYPLGPGNENMAVCGMRLHVVLAENHMAVSHLLQQEMNSVPT